MLRRRRQRGLSNDGVALSADEAALLANLRSYAATRHAGLMPLRTVGYGETFKRLLDKGVLQRAGAEHVRLKAQHFRM